MKQLPLRYTRMYYEEPPKPETGVYNYRIELINSIGERYNYFPNRENEVFYESEYDEPPTGPEYTGELPYRQSLSLKDTNALVSEYQLDENNVYLTASFAEDYLSIEVVHIRKLSDQEQDQEYQDALSSWKASKECEFKRNQERIEQEIARLQAEKDRLSK